MVNKEATARIKINKLLEAAGWRFFAEDKSPANIQLEPSITIKTQDLDALGEDFENRQRVGHFSMWGEPKTVRLPTRNHHSIAWASSCLRQEAVS